MLSSSSRPWCGVLLHEDATSVQRLAKRPSHLSAPANNLPHRQLARIDICVLVLLSHGSPRVIRVWVLPQGVKSIVAVVDEVAHEDLDAYGVVFTQVSKVFLLGARKYVWVDQKKTEALDGRLKVLVDGL